MAIVFHGITSMAVLMIPWNIIAIVVYSDIVGMCTCLSTCGDRTLVVEVRVRTEQKTGTTCAVTSEHKLLEMSPMASKVQCYTKAGVP